MKDTSRGCALRAAFTRPIIADTGSIPSELRSGRVLLSAGEVVGGSVGEGQLLGEVVLCAKP